MKITSIIYGIIIFVSMLYLMIIDNFFWVLVLFFGASVFILVITIFTVVYVFNNYKEYLKISWKQNLKGDLNT